MDWKKLSSRKFLSTVTAFVSLLLIAFGISEEVVTQVVSIIMAGGAVVAYIVTEGRIDAAGVKARKMTDESEG